METKLVSIKEASKIFGFPLDKLYQGGKKRRGTIYRIRKSLRQYQQENQHKNICRMVGCCS